MDKRIHYRLVLDCEAAPMDKTLDKVDPYNMLVYDLGWAIIDKRGKVYETRSFINSDIFLDEKTLMKSAYYADKIPQYWKQIKKGESTLTSFYKIRQAFLKDCQEYRIKEIYAHNMFFDYGALQNTQRWLTKSKHRNFFPYGITICDTLKMARQVVVNTPTYINFCKRNCYLTESGKPRATAEILYRYILGNNNFIEEHKGLQDVLIEKDILAYCFRKHKKMERRLWG